MNSAAVHLAFNTFPPVLNLAAILVFALALIWKSPAVTRTALALVLLSGLIALPVYFSGERAEHMVEELEGVNGVAIHPHEEAAEWAYYLLLAQGAAALVALLWFRTRDVANWAAVATLVITLIATAAVLRTAYLGGKIRHPETEMRR